MYMYCMCICMCMYINMYDTIYMYEMHVQLCIYTESSIHAVWVEWRVCWGAVHQLPGSRPGYSYHLPASGCGPLHCKRSLQEQSTHLHTCYQGITWHCTCTNYMYLFVSPTYTCMYMYIYTCVVVTWSNKYIYMYMHSGIILPCHNYRCTLNTCIHVCTCIMYMYMYVCMCLY